MGQFDTDTSKIINEEDFKNSDGKNKSPRKYGKRNSPRNNTGGIKAFNKEYNPANSYIPNKYNGEKRNTSYDNRKTSESLSLKLASLLKNQELQTYQVENYYRDGASSKIKLDPYNGSTLLHCVSGFVNGFSSNIECFSMILDYSSAEDLAIADNNGKQLFNNWLYTKKKICYIFIYEKERRKKTKKNFIL